MSNGDVVVDADQQQAQAVVAPQQLELQIKLPSFIDQKGDLKIPSHYEETITDLKLTLTVIPKTRSLTNYLILIQGEHDVEQFGEIVTFGQIIEELALGEPECLQIQIREKPYNLAAVYEQIIRLREIVGLHYVDKVSQELGSCGGVTRFNSIKLDPVTARGEAEKSDTNEEEEEQEQGKGKDGKPNEKESGETKETDSQPELSREELLQLSDLVKEIEQSPESINFTQATKFDNINGKVKIPLKSFAVSQWSPVPSFQKTKGDLLYLTVQTLENETFHITSHFTGFFVNKCSATTFNPALKTNEKGRYHKHYLLYELLAQLSPSFTKTIEDNEVKLSESTEHPETYLLPNNSFLAFPWVVNASDLKNIPDSSRSQLMLISNGVDGSEIIKEWNNDIQAMKELPSTNFQERLMRDKLIQKTLFDFSKTATETAINIIKGNIAPMNPGEEPDKLIYLKNGVFYSAGTSTVDVFDKTGGEEASRYVSSKDLAAIKIVNRHELKGISTLVTCIVDYMGKRIVCQAPVPGILDAAPPSEEEDDAGAEQEKKEEGKAEEDEEEEIMEKVLYGLSSDSQKILEDKSFEKPLKLLSEVFHLKPHGVKLSEQVKSEGDLVVSKDTKGLKGTDGRKYAIDLYRTTPRDIEFIEAHFKEGENDSYPHGEALIRHEAVNEWWKRKVSALFAAETEKLEKEGKLEKDGSKGTNSEEKSQIALPIDQVSFNPDAFSSDFESKEDRDEVREISKFIKEKLIPEFIEECQHQLAPFDGQQLSEQLHRYGINLRYLGYIAEQVLVKKAEYEESVEKTIKENEELVKVREAEKVEKDKREAEEAEKAKERAAAQPESSSDDKNQETIENFDAKSKENTESDDKDAEEQPVSKATYELVLANYNSLYRLAIQEMVARASKHVLRQIMRETPLELSAKAVAHFHNCLLGGEINTSPEAEIDPLEASFFSQSAISFAKLTHKDVVAQVAKEVGSRFRFTLEENWIEELVHLPQLFREIALKFGIQWKSFDYTFTKQEFEHSQREQKQESVVDNVEKKHSKKSKKKSPALPIESKPTSFARSSIFIADDIVGFVPLVKDSSYKPTLVDEIFANARSQLLSGDKDLGMAMLAELVTIYEAIYGKVNSQTAKFYSLVAKVYQELGFDKEAAIMGRKAVVLSERSCGFDNHDTIAAYMNSAYFELANSQIANSLKLYLRAMQLWTSTYGKDHPALVNLLTNVADSLYYAKDYESALKLFNAALEACSHLNGQASEIAGLFHFKIANVLVSQQKIEKSKDSFVAANEIFQKLLGPDDSMTDQTSKYISNVAMYIEYLKARQAQSKKSPPPTQTVAPNARVSASQASAKVANGNGTGSSKSKKGKKDKSTPQSDPQIANQSVEDILKFIEGKSKPNAKSKSKHTKA